MVTVVTLNLLAAGVIVRVRLAPEPVRLMLGAGNSMLLEFVNVTWMVPGGSPGSLTEKGRMRVVSSLMIWSGMREMAPVLMTNTPRPRVAAANVSCPGLKDR